MLEILGHILYIWLCYRNKQTFAERKTCFFNFHGEPERSWWIMLKRCLQKYIICICKYFKRKKDATTFSRQACFVNRFTLQGFNGEYSCDYRIYTTKIYIISDKVKRFKVQLLRSNALFLCRHEDTSSLRLFSDESSGRQIIRNFSFRQRLHLLLELL